MKTKIHPKYVECKATCACGASFATRSTKETISIETCSQCHPFYTGKEKLMDTAGRVERFRRKYAGVKKTAKKASVAEVLAEQSEKKDKKRVLLGQPSGKKGEKTPEVKKGEKTPEAKKGEKTPAEKPAEKAEAKDEEKKNEQ